MTTVLDLQEALKGALAEGRHADADRLLSELAVAERRRNRLVHRSLSNEEGRSSYSGTQSVREQVIQAAELAGRPTPIRLIGDLSASRFGEPIPAERLASLRRDEERSWNSSPGSRSVYIVPALTFDRLSPARGVLALSSWPIELRLVAPASPRVDALRILINICHEIDQWNDASWRPALERVTWRLARTVTGALAGSDAGEPLSTERVIDAAQAELATIEQSDTEERASAAERARNQLDEHDLLFGAAPLRAVRGTSTSAEGLR